ncbi:MAG TPA: tRNA pseudouridine(38-40) synthase TruA [Polyangiaceae bacterium]|nr:tRNA pseudouridine(38-40) synthase TruA [Polyangiaceae bacterium]
MAGPLLDGAGETSSAHSIVLTVAYDGSHFSGIAPQTNARTVSAVLKEAIRTMDPNLRGLRIASRTDSGVHARGQVVAFDTETRIAPRGWLLGLSGQLPPEVSVVNAARAKAGFDPSKRAIRKLYRYLILQGSVRDPFYADRAWRIFDPLSHALMQEEANALLGEHDFKAFRGASDPRVNTRRTLERAALVTDEREPRLLAIEVVGNRFLFHMVRIIVGTLVDVGRARLAPGAVARALHSGDREDLGVTAPAEGLYLERIELPDELEEQWPHHSKIPTVA